MELGAPFTDVRIARPDISLYDLVPALPGLLRVNVAPPASGPEVELVFGTGAGAEPAGEDFIRREVERITRRSVLAIRTRTRDPDPIVQPGEEWEAAVAIIERDQGKGPHAASSLLHEAIDAIEAVRYAGAPRIAVKDNPQA